MNSTEGSARASTAIATVPNLISFARIVLIPAFVWLIVHDRTQVAGIVLFSFVVATDWVDGAIARRTGQVSELGRILDPVADRLAVAAGVIALAVAGLFPVWAAALILVRDAGILVVGAILLAGKHVRIDVRFLGKVATFSLMTAIAWIAWGNAGVPLGEVTLAIGWLLYAVGIVESYAAAVVYVGDARRALA
jgi:cardiolipin synthase (CMP-forming)